MKKISLSIVIIAIGLMIITKSNAQNAKPEKVYSFVKVDKPAKWYKEQSELWKKEIDKNSKNSNAWYNYYLAMRYYKRSADTSELRGHKEINLLDILNQMEKKVPNSYEYNLLKFYNGGEDFKLFPYLKKAYDMDPDRVDAYSDLVAYYEATRDTANIKTIMEKWYRTNDFSPGLLALNYNELAPLDKNAIIIVDGDNMYYPKKALQCALGIRTDVKVILDCFFYIDSYKESIFKELKIEPFKKNIKDFNDYSKYLQAIIEYIAKNLKDRPIYFSGTLENYVYENLKDNSYNEGLAYKYSTEKYDNIAVIERNYEKVFFKDYLNYNFTNDVSQSIVDATDLNYVPAFLTLYEHYKESGENDKAKEIKSQIYNALKKSKSKDDYLKSIKQELGEE